MVSSKNRKELSINLDWLTVGFERVKVLAHKVFSVPCDFTEAATTTRVTQHAPLSITSTSNIMLSGLLDEYEGVFVDEDPAASPSASQMSDKEYFEQQKVNAKEKKEAEARKAEAVKVYQAALKERKAKERAMRVDIEKENQRLAVESTNRAAEVSTSSMISLFYLSSTFKLTKFFL